MRSKRAYTDQALRMIRRECKRRDWTTYRLSRAAVINDSSAVRLLRQSNAQPTFESVIRAFVALGLSPNEVVLNLRQSDIRDEVLAQPPA